MRAVGEDEPCAVWKGRRASAKPEGRRRRDRTVCAKPEEPETDHVAKLVGEEDPTVAAASCEGRINAFSAQSHQIRAGSEPTSVFCLVFGDFCWQQVVVGSDAWKRVRIWWLREVVFPAAAHDGMVTWRSSAHENSCGTPVEPESF